MWDVVTMRITDVKCLLFEVRLSPIGRTDSSVCLLCTTSAVNLGLSDWNLGLNILWYNNTRLLFKNFLCLLRYVHLLRSGRISSVDTYEIWIKFKTTPNCEGLEREKKVKIFLRTPLIRNNQIYSGHFRSEKLQLKLKPLSTFTKFWVQPLLSSLVQTILVIFNLTEIYIKSSSLRS